MVGRTRRFVFGVGFNSTFPCFETDPLERRLRRGCLLRHPQVSTRSKDVERTKCDGAEDSPTDLQLPTRQPPRTDSSRSRPSQPKIKLFRPCKRPWKDFYTKILSRYGWRHRCTRTGRLQRDLCTSQNGTPSRVKAASACNCTVRGVHVTVAVGPRGVRHKAASLRSPPHLPPHPRHSSAVPHSSLSPLIYIPRMTGSLASHHCEQSRLDGGSGYWTLRTSNLSLFAFPRSRFHDNSRAMDLVCHYFFTALRIATEGRKVPCYQRSS